MTNTDKLRQHYLTMPHYHFDMTIDDYPFSDKEQADIAKYGNWFQAIWDDKVPLVTDKLKRFYAAKNLNCRDRGKFEELWMSKMISAFKCVSTQITAQVKTMIRDNLLWLPEKSYLDDEVETKTVDVYQHIYSNYYGGGASTYNNYAA